MTDAPPGAVSFEVDLEGLRLLALRIDDLRRQLGRITLPYGRFERNGLGAAVVQDGFDDFAGKWAYGRDRIDDELDEVASLVKTAVERYAAAEEAIGGVARATLRGAKPGHERVRAVYQPPATHTKYASDTACDDYSARYEALITNIFGVSLGTNGDPAEGVQHALRAIGLMPEGSVVVIRSGQNPDGSTRFLVLLRGIDMRDVRNGSGESPNDWSDAATIAVARRSEYTRSIEEAISEAGAMPGDHLSFIGHSQGGMAARALAGDRRFNGGTYQVDNVVTAGSPVRGWPLANPATHALGLQNSFDVVPGLNPQAIAESAVTGLAGLRAAFGGAARNESWHHFLAPRQLPRPITGATSDTVLGHGIVYGDALNGYSDPVLDRMSAQGYFTGAASRQNLTIVEVEKR